MNIPQAYANIPRYSTHRYLSNAYFMRLTFCTRIMPSWPFWSTATYGSTRLRRACFTERPGNTGVNDDGPVCWTGIYSSISSTFESGYDIPTMLLSFWVGLHVKFFWKMLYNSIRKECTTYGLQAFHHLFSSGYFICQTLCHLWFLRVVENVTPSVASSASSSAACYRCLQYNLPIVTHPWLSLHMPATALVITWLLESKIRV